MFNLSFHLQLLVLVVTYLLYVSGNLSHPLGIALLSVSMVLAFIGLYLEYKEERNEHSLR